MKMSKSHPDISSYHPDKIDMKKCLSRRFGPEDRRWAPIIYSSRQCTSAPMKGHDLCPTCVGREAAHNPADKTNTRWIGRVTDPKSIPAHIHMPGSKWFEDKKPVWLGVERPVQKRTIVASNSSASVASAASSDDASGCFKLLQGEFYWVVDSNVYEYDPIEEMAGELVGLLRADGAIDAVAVAVAVAVAEVAEAPVEVVEAAVVAPVEVPVEVVEVAAPVEASVMTPAGASVMTPVGIKRRRKGLSRSTQEIRRLKEEINKLRLIIRLLA